MRALVLVLAAGCGRIGFGAQALAGGGSAGGDGGNGGDGGVLADADPGVVFAGSCTTAARHAIGTGTVEHMTATLDGIVYGDDFGELDSFQFANGALVPRAMQPMFASEVDVVAASAAGDQILVLDLASSRSYTIVDRSLAGPPLAAFPLSAGDFGAAGDGSGFVVAGFIDTINYNSAVALTGSTATTALVPLTTSVPAIASIAGGFVVAISDAGGCHWRWLDAAGSPTGVAADDTFECAFPVLAPDDAGNALIVWQSTTAVQVRVRDLTTRAWLSTAVMVSSIGSFDAMFVAARGWYVASNSGSAPAQIRIVADDGTLSAPMFTLPETTEAVRLFTIAGRPYVAWIGSGPTLAVQPLCF